MVGLTGAGRPLNATAVMAITAILALVAAPNALAGTFDVNSTADSTLGGSVTCAGSGSTCTLRAAVQAADAAGGASTITLPAGRYTLTIPARSGGSGSDADDPASGDLDVDNNAAISVVGNGAGTTVINAGGIDRAFAVHAGASLTLTGLTIQGGIPAAQSSATQEGGAIYTDGTLSTTDVNFTANGALSDGGAIYADTDSRLSVNGGSFTGNGGSFLGSPTAYGGAIEDASTNPAQIADAAFSQNTAFDSGGDVYFWGSGALTVSDSTFSDTVGTGTGGAISASGTGRLTVTDSQFTGDSSSSGGAIFSSGPISLTTDSFTYDTATGSSLGTGGGALYLQGASGVTQTLLEDQFSEDSASVYGGAIYTDGGTLEMGQSSIVGSGALYGAGVYLGSNSALLEDDTIAQNSAMQGGALYLLGSAPLSLVNDTIAQNTAADGDGGGIFGAASAVVGSGDGIVNTVIADNVGGDCDSVLRSSVVTGYDLDSDSSCLHGLSTAGLQVGVQPALAAPANNGGQVLTMLEQAGSPTIGAGDGAYCPTADARTVARNPSSCDLGAYQAISTGLTASLTAPASAATGAIFSIKVAATNLGPGIAGNLTFTDQLPAGATLAGEQPSSGTCAVSGTPSQLTCDFGTVAGGASAGVTLFLSSTTIGTFSDTATLSDDQGATAAATATVQLTSTTTPTQPSATTTPTQPSATPAPTQPSSPIVTLKPTISRAEILQITGTAATLRARLDPNGNTVSYFFQYGTTPQFGRTTRLIVTSQSGVRSARVVGLRAGRRYYFRLVATNGSVVAHEPTYSFVTSAPKARRPQPKPHPEPKRHPKPRTHKKPTKKH